MKNPTAAKTNAAVLTIRSTAAFTDYLGSPDGALAMKFLDRFADETPDGYRAAIAIVKALAIAERAAAAQEA